MTPITQRRLEAAAILAFCSYAYFSQGYSAIAFAYGFFLPDLSILAYFKNPRVGAIAYNTAHCLLLPVALGGYALFGGEPLALQCALIWAAHIGFDRALGWGLKYPDSFCSTDMGRKTLPLDVPILR